MKYFSNLNYTVGNEDTGLEYEILPEHADHVVAIAGSGSRIIPLLARSPGSITCVDTSFAQLAYAQTRIETLRTCTRAQYLAFWGYGSHSMLARERRLIFESLRLPDRVFGVLSELFEAHAWEGVLYAGRWERTFNHLSSINRIVLGKHAHALFEHDDHAKHRVYIETHFPHTRWRTLVALFGNPVLFNALLYKGQFPRHNVPTSITDYYQGAFDRLFALGPARYNFFMQLLMLGRIVHDDGLPFECTEEVFSRAQRALSSCCIEYRQESVPELFTHLSRPSQFISLSDVASYFSPPEEQSFMRRMLDSLSPGARVVNRYYLRTPERVDTDGYVDITAVYADCIAREKVQMYTVQVFERV